MVCANSRIFLWHLQWRLDIIICKLSFVEMSYQKFKRSYPKWQCITTVAVRIINCWRISWTPPNESMRAISTSWLKGKDLTNKLKFATIHLLPWLKGIGMSFIVGFKRVNATVFRSKDMYNMWCTMKCNSISFFLFVAMSS